MEKEKTATRQSNFELLRIICIALIICFHYISEFIHGEFRFNQIWVAVFGLWGIVGVNCFIMISAYFLRDSQTFKSKRLFKIIFQTIFYTAGSLLFVYIFKIEPIEKIEIFQSFFPVFFNQYWYITAYVFLYMIHTFLNKMMNGISDTALKKLLILLTIFIPLYNTVYVWYDMSFEIVGNFTFVVYVYLLMGYLKKHEGNWFEKNAKRGFVFTSLFVIASNLICSYLATKYQIPKLATAKKFTARFSVVMVFDALFLFYIFKNLNIGNSKVINTISKTTLGMYLFHENLFMRRFLSFKVFLIEIRYASKFFILYIFMFIAIIFVITAIIEVFRIYLIEKPVLKLKPLNNLFEKIDAWMNDTKDCEVQNT